MDDAGAIDVDRYLARIGVETELAVDVLSLEILQRAHLSTVPFENLDVVAGVDVPVDPNRAVDKIVTRKRGGWCFENNGAFAELLQALGFDVTRLGAAVLLDGPNSTIDHLTLEVRLDRPYLVDVGFGDSFIRPLELNSRRPQDGGTAVFELIDSAEGVTLTRHDADGVPEPQFRFKRVRRQMHEFEPATDHLQSDPDLHWSNKPFATRLLDGGPDRVTLLGDRLKVARDGMVAETPVAPDEWDATLEHWFSMRRPESPEG